ncbi:MAG: hypothetical protein ABJF11_08860 [Reichenbachiella sp.]|uniref:hypothetical protein n=1 Tax=Reichenbachiella sp. TaxID=2184521 RepID=UPI003267A974
MIKSSDAKIISKDGMEILQNEKKLREVSEAIENFKRNTDKSAHSKHIVVNL